MDPLLLQHHAALYECTVTGTLSCHTFRSIAWKVFLGILPHDNTEWSSLLSTLRLDYTVKRQEYIIDPTVNEISYNINLKYLILYLRKRMIIH